MEKLRRSEWAWQQIHFSFPRDAAGAALAGALQAVYRLGVGQQGEVVTDFIAVGATAVAGGLLVPTGQFILRWITARREQAEQRVSELLRERQTLTVQLSELRNRRPVDRDDWLRVAGDFEAVHGTTMSADSVVFATWKSTFDSWELRGPADVTNRVEELCRLAGSMLVASSTLGPRLPTSVVSETDALRRWLEFLKWQSSAYRVEGSQELLQADGTRVEIHVGLLPNLPLVCANHCRRCASAELSLDGAEFSAARPVN